MNEEDNELLTIDEIIKELEDIKAKQGNVKVAMLVFSEDYPTQVIAIKPCIVTNPDNEKEYLVIFD